MSDFFEDKRNFYVEMPLIGNPGLDLFDYIEIKGSIPEKKCQHLFAQIAAAIAHLHKHGIVHRDIKEENIVLNEDEKVTLVDFGSAAYTKDGLFEVYVGTSEYAAPEVLRGNKYEGKPQDIWASGILLYTMIYKERPFYSIQEILNEDVHFPFSISQPCIDLLKYILTKPVDKRANISEIQTHTWLQSTKTNRNETSKFSATI